MDYFEGYDLEQGTNPYGEHLLIKDKDSGETVGSAYYSLNPDGEGTSIFYIGYGDKLHPVDDAEKVEEIKKQNPRLGVQIFKWVRKNLPQPYYAAFANQDLKRSLRAEPTGMTGFDPEGQPVSIDIVRRSNERKIMSSNEKVDRVKKELLAKNYDEYNKAMADLWESVSPGMGQKYTEKYHGPQKSEKELKEWAKEEQDKIDPTETKRKSLDNKEKSLERKEKRVLWI